MLQSQAGASILLGSTEKSCRLHRIHHPRCKPSGAHDSAYLVPLILVVTVSRRKMSENTENTVRKGILLREQPFRPHNNASSAAHTNSNVMCFDSPLRRAVIRRRRYTAVEVLPHSRRGRTSRVRGCFRCARTIPPSERKSPSFLPPWRTSSPSTLPAAQPPGAI